MQSTGDMLTRMLRGVEERRRWEAANAGLAQAWSEALHEDHERSQRREAEVEAARLDAAIPLRLRSAGVPEAAIEALSATPPSPESLGPWKAAGEFLQSDARTLALFGSVGTGKTVAAVRVLAWGFRRGLAGWFVRASTFARLSGYDRNDRVWFEQLCDDPIIVLDDLGTEHLNEYGRSMFHEWFDRRTSDRRLRTVLTANLQRGTAEPPTGFVGRYGARINDRLSSGCVLHVSAGTSLRRRSP